MFTNANYFKKAEALDFNSMPETLQKGHAFVQKATQGGKNWDAYHDSEAIHKTIDAYFQKLAEHLEKHGGASGKKSAKGGGGGSKKPRAAKPKVEKPQEPSANMVSKIPEEIRFIKRFTGLHGKTKTKDEILRFLNSVQKAFVEKRIRRTSQWHSQMVMIQDKLLDTYETMPNKLHFELSQETFEELRIMGKSEKLLPSVSIIKRYISMNGKAGMKDKARALLATINSAEDKNKIRANDSYRSQLNEIKENLEAFISTRSIKILRVSKSALNGLNSVMNGFSGTLGCYCQK